MLLDYDTIIYASLVLYALYALMTHIRKKNHLERTWLRMILIFVAWMYFTCLIDFTLFPIQMPPAFVKASAAEFVQINPLSSFFPIEQINFYQLVGNIGLFFPFIPLVSILRKKEISIKCSAMFSLILSLTIEFLQFLEDISGLCSYFFRQADTADVMMNVAGGVMGCAVINIWWKYKKRRA